MKRKAAKPDNDWQVTPIPRIARKKRKVSKLLSSTQVSSAPPTPYEWEIPPTPPKGETGNENIEAVKCNQCQNQFSSNAILGLHECVAQPPTEKRKRGRPRKLKIEESPIDVSGDQSVEVIDKDQGQEMNSSDF